MDCEVKSCHHTAPLWALSLPLPTTVATTTGCPTAAAGTAAWGLPTNKKNAANHHRNKYNRINSVRHTVKPIKNKQLPSTTMWGWFFAIPCMDAYCNIGGRFPTTDMTTLDNGAQTHANINASWPLHANQTHVWYKWYTYMIQLMQYILHYVTLHWIRLDYIKSLNHFTWYYIKLHYITLRHTTSHCITLHHISSHT